MMATVAATGYERNGEEHLDGRAGDEPHGTLTMTTSSKQAGTRAAGGARLRSPAIAHGEGGQAHAHRESRAQLGGDPQGLQRDRRKRTSDSRPASRFDRLGARAHRETNSGAVTITAMTTHRQRRDGGRPSGNNSNASGRQSPIDHGQDQAEYRHHEPLQRHGCARSISRQVAGAATAVVA